VGIYYCYLALHSCSNVATCRTNQINTTKIREVVSVANAGVGHCAYKAEFFQVDLSRSAQQLLSQRVSLCFYVSVFLCDCVSVSVSVSICQSVSVSVSPAIFHYIHQPAVQFNRNFYVQNLMKR